VRSSRTPGEAILSIHELSGIKKPQSASLELRRGEVLGIAGLVGAGRTELMRAIFGLDPVRSGQVRVGAFSGAAAPAQRWRQGVGLLSEDRKGEGLALSMSIADNMTLTRLAGLGSFGLVYPNRQRTAAQRWVDTLNIKCLSPAQSVVNLSGGNQQKVALARLLYHDVDVLLLDEPTRGIDVVSKRLIYECIDKLACGDPQNNIPPKAVLMVSSYLPELFGVCDRIAVMCRGRLNPPHPVETVTQQTIMLEATGSAVERCFQ